MGEMTLEQQRALAMASARARAAQAQQKTPEQPQNAGVGFQDMVTRGLTGGISDYVSAGGRYLADKALGRGESFNDELKSVRQDNTAYRDANPVKAYGGEIGGGVVSPMFRGIFGAVDKGLTSAGNFLGRQIPRYLQYGVQGAVPGALVGAVGAEGNGGGLPSASDVGKGAALGGAVGGAMGVAIPAVAEGAQWAGGKLKDAGQTLLDHMPNGQDSSTGRRVYRALQADKLTPDQALAAARELGPQATLADVSPNLQALGENAATRQGAALTAAKSTLEGRQAGQGTRVIQALEDGMGPENFSQTTEALFKQRSAEAGPLYEKAFSPNDTRPLKSDLLERLQTRPVFQEGVKRGITDIMDEAAITGKQHPIFSDTWYEGANFDDPNLVIKKMPTLRVLDAAKRGLDSILSGGGEEIRNPMTGKLTQRGMRVEDMRNALVGELDKLTDGTYKAARGAWAGPSRALEMMNEGMDFIKSGRSALDVAQVKDLTDVDKQFMRIGAKQALGDLVENTQDGANVVRRLFGTKMMRNKLEALFPDKSAFDQFAKQMGAENKFFETGRNVLGNSRTAFRNAMAEDEGSDLAGVAVEAARGNFGSAAMNAARTAGRALTRPSPQVSDRLSPIFSQNPKEQAALLELARKRAAMGQIFGSRTLPLLARTPPALLSVSTGGSNQRP